jgi:hypothetical protein
MSWNDLELEFDLECRYSEKSKLLSDLDVPSQYFMAESYLRRNALQ